jgi:hypothetical protein
MDSVIETLVPVEWSPNLPQSEKCIGDGLPVIRPQRGQRIGGNTFREVDLNEAAAAADASACG